MDRGEGDRAARRNLSAVRARAGPTPPATPADQRAAQGGCDRRRPPLDGGVSALTAPGTARRPATPARSVGGSPTNGAHMQTTEAVASPPLSLRVGQLVEVR